MADSGSPVRPDDLRRTRVYDPERQRRIAAGGGPSRDGDAFHVWCPDCDCQKSGSVDEPNDRDPGCRDPRCVCHSEAAAVEAVRDYSTSAGPDPVTHEYVEVPEDERFPMLCNDCLRPAYYDYGDDAYHHAVRPHEGCFLIPAEDRDADPAHPFHRAWEFAARFAFTPAADAGVRLVEARTFVGRAEAPLREVRCEVEGVGPFTALVDA